VRGTRLIRCAEARRLTEGRRRARHGAQLAGAEAKPQHRASPGGTRIGGTAGVYLAAMARLDRLSNATPRLHQSRWVTWPRTALVAEVFFRGLLSSIHCTRLLGVQFMVAMRWRS
jgi:hypothetical protein